MIAWLSSPTRLALTQFVVPPAILLIGFAACLGLAQIDPNYGMAMYFFLFTCVFECIGFLLISLVFFVKRPDARKSILLWVACCYSLVAPCILGRVFH